MVKIQRDKLKRKVLILIISVIVLFVTGVLSYPMLTNYLSLTNTVDADILLVEGWMPDYAINMAVREFEKNSYSRIITTGLEENKEYYLMSMNGNLVFFLNESILKSSENLGHTIEIDLYGDTKGSNKAHFNVFVNDSLISSLYAKKRKKVYEVEWGGKLNDGDSISIQFDNDLIGHFGDRNIHVKQITIDHDLVYPYKNNSIYNITNKYYKERRANFDNTYAEIARSRLIGAGLDSTKIASIPAERISLNRTLSSALAVRNYFELEEYTSGNINVLSIGPHSRRTWITYKKVLGKDYSIGIIALPDYKPGYTRIKRVLNCLEELLKIFYYKIILVRYSSFGTVIIG